MVIVRLACGSNEFLTLYIRQFGIKITHTHNTHTTHTTHTHTHNCCYLIEPSHSGH